jgi:hypothetical protein
VHQEANSDDSLPTSTGTRVPTAMVACMALPAGAGTPTRTHHGTYTCTDATVPWWCVLLTYSCTIPKVPLVHVRPRSFSQLAAVSPPKTRVVLQCTIRELESRDVCPLPIRKAIWKQRTALPNCTECTRDMWYNVYVHVYYGMRHAASRRFVMSDVQHALLVLLLDDRVRVTTSQIDLTSPLCKGR